MIRQRGPCNGAIAANPSVAEEILALLKTGTGYKHATEKQKPMISYFNSKIKSNLSTSKLNAVMRAFLILCLNILVFLQIISFGWEVIVFDTYMNNYFPTLLSKWLYLDFFEIGAVISYPMLTSVRSNWLKSPLVLCQYHHLISQDSHTLSFKLGLRALWLVGGGEVGWNIRRYISSRECEHNLRSPISPQLLLKTNKVIFNSAGTCFLLEKRLWALVYFCPRENIWAIAMSFPIYPVKGVGTT